MEFADTETKARIPMRLSESEEDCGTEAQRAFSHFAASNFRGNVTYQFTKNLLKQSLLDLPLPSDQVVNVLNKCYGYLGVFI